MGCSDLTKVPGFPIDVQAAAINPILVQGQLCQGCLDLLHGAQHEVAHDIKPEAINLQHEGVVADVHKRWRRLPWVCCRQQ